MPDKDQVFIFNKDELSLIKNTFADNDTLLYTVRKVLLQFPLSEAEKGLIRLSITPAVIAVLKKRILPEIGPEFPLGQLPSLLTTLSQDMKSKSQEDLALLFEAKQLEIDYLEQQFAELGNLDSTQPIKLAEMARMDFVKLTAYLFLLAYIDPSLLMIKSLAGDKGETYEEQVERLSKDSNK